MIQGVGALGCATMALRFRDRRDAGRALADAFLSRDYRDRPDVLVLALPRGGVPVAFELAEALDAPLDLMLVRKLGLPGHEELAMGAIASGGVRVLNREVVEHAQVPADVIDRVSREETRELKRREHAYRGDRPPPNVQDKRIIVVDDGLATGSTMFAAVRALRAQDPAAVIVGVPVAPPETCDALRREVDEIVCAQTPQDFRGVGQFYDDFDQTTDDEVIHLLRRAWEKHAV